MHIRRRYSRAPERVEVDVDRGSQMQLQTRKNEPLRPEFRHLSFGHAAERGLLTAHIFRLDRRRVVMAAPFGTGWSLNDLAAGYGHPIPALKLLRDNGIEPVRKKLCFGLMRSPGCHCNALACPAYRRVNRSDALGRSRM